MNLKKLSKVNDSLRISDSMWEEIKAKLQSSKEGDKFSLYFKGDDDSLHTYDLEVVENNGDNVTFMEGDSYTGTMDENSISYVEEDSESKEFYDTLCWKFGD